MDALQYAPAQRYRKAFLFGCIQPDCNLFTFLKGSPRELFLDGHNFKNTERHIFRSVEKLQNRDGWLMLKYYRLGKLTHYLSDAFTAPHNDSFSIADHVRYEIGMHDQLEKEVAATFDFSTQSKGSSIKEFILSAHNQYASSSKNQKTDVAYVLGCTNTVFNQLLPEEKLVGIQLTASQMTSA